MIKLFLLCLISGISGFSGTTWLTYTDNVNHFTMKYPETWTQKSGVNLIAFLSPRENEKDSFQENVNLLLQDLSQQKINLAQYTELTKQQIIDNFGPSAIVSTKPTMFAGQQSEEFIYNMNYQGRQLKIRQYWFIKNNLAYLFTYTAEPSQYSKYESLAMEIINSFTFS
jgi:serine/threonine-protein kinase